MKGKREPDCNIELGLAIFETEDWQRRRRRWTRRLRLSSVPSFDELAALCGCKRSAMQEWVLKAQRKMRIRLIEKLPEREIRDALQALSRATARKEYHFPE
jgi:hypothetical protein